MTQIQKSERTNVPQSIRYGCYTVVGYVQLVNLYHLASNNVLTNPITTYVRVRTLIHRKKPKCFLNDPQPRAQNWPKMLTKWSTTRIFQRTSWIIKIKFSFRTWTLLKLPCYHRKGQSSRQQHWKNNKISRHSHTSHHFSSDPPSFSKLYTRGGTSLSTRARMTTLNISTNNFYILRLVLWPSMGTYTTSLSSNELEFKFPKNPASLFSIYQAINDNISAFKV